MMKRIGCLLVAGLLLAAEPPGEAAKKDLGQMQGEWKIEKGIRRGKLAPADELAKTSIRIEGATLTIGLEAREDQAQITLDPTKAPATIDMKPVAEGHEPIFGIYKIEGDTLTLCWVRGGKRPTEFESPKDSPNMLLVLKRVKK